MEQGKICTKCDKMLPLSEYYTIFSKQQKKPYTYNYCRKCHYSKLTKHTAAAWRKKNPDAWKEDMRKANKAWRGRQASVVYLIHTDKGDYIGHTGAWDMRLQQHQRSMGPGHLIFKGATILSHEILAEEDNYYKRCQLEKYFIEKYKPELNIQGNPDWEKTYRGGWVKKS